MAIKDLIISQRRADLLRAVFEPGKENADRFGFSLDMKELAALRYAIAHWSFLEEAILQTTLGIPPNINNIPDPTEIPTE
jgi:hypothetical protein